MADIKNAKDGKFRDVKDEENSNKEPKQEGKGKRILRAIAREAMFTIVGASAVGAVWAYTDTKKKKGSKEGDSDNTDEQSDVESVENT